MNDSNMPDTMMKTTALDSARRVIAREIEGLSALNEALDGHFAAAAQLILESKGRLLLSGMGKSGHIARKIAATFSSTGTPSYFIHPSEASHGDLGMITPQDVLMLLSNSGETVELRDIILHAKRFSIPLIAIVRRRTSMLVEAATLALVLPDVAEASPVEAPTTSTTMMLALGDALAVSVLEQRGFGKEDFHLLHPGGKLGKIFIRVQDLMHKGAALPLVAEEARMHEVLLEMTAKSFGCAGVIDEQGKLLGIITDGDLRRHMAPSLLERRAREIMTKNPIAVPPQLLAAEALQIMNARAITNIFVVEEGKPAGILHVHDCLRAGIA
jgi:arabinose-5-phosphate isomerase